MLRSWFEFVKYTVRNFEAIRSVRRPEKTSDENWTLIAERNDKEKEHGGIDKRKSLLIIDIIENQEEHAFTASIYISWLHCCILLD